MSERVYISCSAPYGAGGLGQRLAELVETQRQRGNLVGYFCARGKESDPLGIAVEPAAATSLQTRLFRHFGPGWRNRFGADAFDRSVSRRLPRPIDCVIGFAGQALRTFRRARALGAGRLELVAPTAHVAHAAVRYREAVRRHPIEGTWLNDQLVEKTRREYELADIIWVVSDYAAETFVHSGVRPDKIFKIPTSIAPRFCPQYGSAAEDAFRVVYTGSLTVTKGTPLLLEAYEQLDCRRKQLRLIGGWATRGMRRYLQSKTRGRADIRIGPGDPLEDLQNASVYVHPSWQDGYGRAAAEAMRCGVPVIVTDDTGMKELIREGDTGFVVPTGDVSAIRRQLERAASRQTATASG